MAVTTTPPSPVRTVGEGDHRVAVLDEGDGPAVLLVHVGMWSILWRDVIADLAVDHRCVAPDAPASGRSAGEPRRDATLASAARSVTAVVEGLDLRDLVLVVHDLGTPAALLAAASWPERVRAVVVVNGFGWRPSGAAFRGMLALMGSGPIRLLDTWTGFLPRLASTRMGVGRHLGRADRRAFRAGMDRRGREAFHRYMASARTLDDAALARARHVLRDRPTVTVFGARNDPLRFQARWRAEVPGVRQVTVPRGNHFPMCDAPDLVADVIRGLTAAPGGQSAATTTRTA